MSHWRLKALRLVGFHNFEDVVIPVTGDLFVVGPNESGKTTLLDALHLALSGGQDMDFNAAARLVGPRNEGRTLQGIILRSDLSGEPRKKGGSISYAAAEFVTDGNASPFTLVWGASAADMKSRARQWGAISRVPAQELPLTEPQPDGSCRIRNRDEIEASLDGHLYKNMNAYRTAVGDMLLGAREEFDRVTDLWRKAKSYRELVRAARSVTDVIRGVLPDPDPTPFEKISKGFRDLAEIELNLHKLSEDVNDLGRLRELLQDAREARETLRRYRYVQAHRRLEALLAEQASLVRNWEDALKKKESLKADAAHLQSEIQSLTAQIAELRSSESYSLVEQLKAARARLQIVEGRLSEIDRRLESDRAYLRQARQRLGESRGRADRTIRETRRAIQQMVPQCQRAVPNLAGHLNRLLELVPSSPDEELPESETEARVSETRSSAQRELEEAHQLIAELRHSIQALSQELDASRKRLKRLEHFKDLIPDLDGLHLVLDRLARRKIPASLLYQKIEFREGVEEERQAAVESAMGIEVLSTIIVPPGQVETARRVVLDAGQGLRVMDARAVESPEMPPGGPARLTNLLQINDARLRSHLRSTMGQLRLLKEPAEDGASLAWFTRDGLGGSHGARWRLELDPPRWIGEERRRAIREAEVREIRGEIAQKQERKASQGKELKKAEGKVVAIKDTLQRLVELAHPHLLVRAISEWKQNREQVAAIEQRLRERTEDKSQAEIERDGQRATIKDLEQQIEQSDAAAVARRIEELDAAFRSASDQKVRNEERAEQLEHRAGQLQRDLEETSNRCVASQQELGRRRTELVELLPEEVSGELDRYVFQTRRGAQIRDENLQAYIETALRQESSLLERLKGADGVLHENLAARYGFRIDEATGSLEIRDRGNQTLEQAWLQRQEEEQQWRESLGRKERELFEQILARDLIDRLRSELNRLQRVVRQVNSVLEPLVFGHSRFHLRERTSPNQARLVELVRRQSLLDEESREELRHFLEDRRDAFDTEGEIPPFLDYRQWFEFSFGLKHIASEEVAPLASEDMVRGSGGAQATHHYILLFAIAGLLFNSTESKIRLLMMDEAFYGLDSERKELLLRCGKQLGLDFVIATPDLDGTIQEHSGDTTTVLVEKDEQDNVILVPFNWEQVQPQGELFAEERPKPVIGSTVKS